MLNIRELLDEMENKGLYNERKELIRELSREDVSEVYYSSYVETTCEEDRKYDLNEYLDNQAIVLDSFFPISTNNGNVDVELSDIEYEENTAIYMELIEE